MANEEMGRFGFDGAEGIAFWVYSDASQEEAQSTIMFVDMPVLVEFLRHNFPGYFEQAHTPTDDDREALRREFEYRVRTAVTYGIGRGKHDDMSSQQKADWIQREIASAMSSRAVIALRRPVQGEPTDSQVEAALLGYFPEVEGQPDLQDWGNNTRKRMRAALRAAAAVQGGGTEMHSDDYTPTTDEVREFWASRQTYEHDWTIDTARSIFDRWFAGVIAEKRAEWEGGA